MSHRYSEAQGKEVHYDDYTKDGNGEIAVPGGRWPSYAEALPVTLGNGAVRDYARQVADSIIEDARTVHGPVVWITGNAYMPPLRSIALAERVWQAANNDDGELFAWFGELVEGHLQDAHVMLECPDYDNALYAVDLSRWEYDEDATDSDDLNGEWKPKQ